CKLMAVEVNDTCCCLSGTVLDRAQVFYIVRGRIVLKLHKSYHTLESGDFFYIPPCNTYHIQNLGSEDVELVFTQLKTTAK
ncbi:hypothetical protein AB205_0196440, partial [Aquarana catesbeiana]